jgi:hypothetical protein
VLLDSTSFVCSLVLLEAPSSLLSSGKWLDVENCRVTATTFLNKVLF